MKNLRLHFLFKKYLDRSCTPDEYNEMMLLISDDANDQELKGLIDAAGVDFPIEKLGHRKAERIYQTILQGSEGIKQIKLYFRLSRFLLMTASILVILAIGVILNRREKVSMKAAQVMISKTVDDHQLVRLSDGSTVTLNKNSRITYPAVFNGTTREVSLIGEAYFDIRHNAHKPFLVHVGDVTVTVLGTAFNISSDLKGKGIAVTVTRGKVSVSKDQIRIATLTPNHQINIADEKIPKPIDIDATQVIAWQADDIYFDDVTMGTAMKTLENRFGEKIIFDSERVKHCMLTGTFTHNESLQQILKVLCSFNNAKYETSSDQSIHISGPGCQ